VVLPIHEGAADAAALLNSMLCMFKAFSLAMVVTVGDNWLDVEDCHIMEELGS
jgi:hypothetical protein